uniref:Uncharacterized protein n=1 Tax=Sphaerodactylus townsendi TaxID=933632 RepID=A0ACB8FSP3_9SAUR
MNVILEDVVQKMEQSTERILGTSSEALKAKVRKDIQEFRHNMQRQLQSPRNKQRSLHLEAAGKPKTVGKTLEGSEFPVVPLFPETGN